MAYIPKIAEWWIATLVEEIRVEGAKRNVVHLNHVLVRADSADDAYSRAVELGRQSSATYRNPAGQKVTVRFRGLRALDVIHDPLEHGCELTFQERLGMSEAGIRKLLTPKKQLEVFLPPRGRRGRPDYASKDIMDEVARSAMTSNQAMQRTAGRSAF